MMRSRSSALLAIVALIGVLLLPLDAASAGGTFVDDDTSIFEADIEWVASEGITKGCNPPANDKYCPDDFVTRGQMAAFVVRALEYTTGTGTDRFADDDTSVFEADIDRLAAAGVTKGCNPPANDKYCPDDFVTRGQMAAFVVRALEYTTGTGTDRFADDDTSVFEADIDRLAAAGVTKGCNPPANDKYCPDDFVTRGQMAAFLHRALAATASPEPLGIATVSLPTGDVGTPYNAALTAFGGVSPYTWSIATGTLPTGLTLNPDGTITGTPTTHADTTITFEVEDSQPATATTAIDLVINPKPLGITTVSLPTGDVGTPYNSALTATGGVTPYTWSITTGTLPAGLSLNPDGTVTGTPTVFGAPVVTVLVTDSVGVSDSRILSIDVSIADPICVQSYIPQIECDALVELYDSTAGASWTTNTGWLVAPDPCSWHGVGCLSGRVHQVNLQSNNVVGLLPPSLGHLENLEQLRLIANALTGPIPPEFGNLTALRALFLSGNQLGGPIPPELASLTHLERLDLRSNQLTGPIPSELGSATTLVDLLLGANGLTGAIPPELGNLTALEDLSLYENQFSGPLPSALGSLPSIEELYLRNNQFTGAIPAELGNLGTLRVLDLWDNQLTGSIPTEIGQLSQLEYLHLHFNQLSGRIPSELGSLGQLIAMRLHHNQLDGALPTELGSLSLMELLWLQNNELSGDVPDSLRTGTAITSLKLNGQTGCLTATVPEPTNWLNGLDPFWNDGC